MSEPLRIHDEDNPRAGAGPDWWSHAPQSSCNDPLLLHSDRTVLSVLSFLAHRTWPIVLVTMAEVARRTGMSEENLRLCYRRLEKAGWIERARGPRKWCTPRQITLLFELRGYQLESAPNCTKTNPKPAGGNNPKPAGGNNPKPAGGNSNFPPYNGDLRRSSNKECGGKAPRTPRQPNWFELQAIKNQEYADYMTGPDGQAMVDEIWREMHPEGDKA